MHRLMPLDRDRAVQMRSTPINRSRYNALIYARASDVDPVVCAPRDRRPSIDQSFDPMLCVRPRHLHQINLVWISPTREISWETVGFIIPDGL